MRRNPNARGQCQEYRGGKDPRVWFCHLITLALHLALGPSGVPAAAGCGRGTRRQTDGTWCALEAPAKKSRDQDKFITSTLDDPGPSPQHTPLEADCLRKTG